MSAAKRWFAATAASVSMYRLSTSQRLDKLPTGSNNIPKLAGILKNVRREAAVRRDSGVRHPANVVQKSDPTLITNWGQNFDQNEISFCIKLGIGILIKMRSRFESNLGSEFCSGEIPCWLKLGVRIFIKMRSMFGSNFGSEF